MLQFYIIFAKLVNLYLPVSLNPESTDGIPTDILVDFNANFFLFANFNLQILFCAQKWRREKVDKPKLPFLAKLPPVSVLPEVL